MHFFFLPQSGCRENIRPSGKGPLCDTQGGLSQVGRQVESLLAAVPQMCIEVGTLICQASPWALKSSGSLLSMAFLLSHGC